MINSKNVILNNHFIKLMKEKETLIKILLYCISEQKYELMKIYFEKHC